MRKYHSIVDAAEEGDLKSVQSMLSEGHDVNTRGFFKVTPLMYAVTGGHADIVRLLLQQPTLDPNMMNSGGTTALMAAARQGNVEILRLLLADERTDANFVGKWGGTAMINAAGYGKTEAVKELLKVKGIRLDATYTDRKFSPVTLARFNGHEDIARILESHISSTSPERGIAKPPRPAP